MTFVIMQPTDGGVPATDVECHAIELLIQLAVVGEAEKFAATVRKVFGSTEEQRRRRIGGLCDGIA